MIELDIEGNGTPLLGPAKNIKQSVEAIIVTQDILLDTQKKIAQDQARMLKEQAESAELIKKVLTSTVIIAFLAFVIVVIELIK